MRWDRKEYLDYVTFKENKRPMFVELFGPLIGLEEEWIEQGATEDEINMTAFDWDYVPYVNCGANCDIFDGPEERVIEETKEHIITIDALGRKMKLMKGAATIPLPMDYPVKNMDDWLKLKHLYQFREERIDYNQVAKAKKQQQQGVMVRAEVPGGFDLPRQLMGEEELCYAYYEQPELIEDILNTAADTAIKCCERLSKHLIVDHLHIHEDMAGKSGSLIGPVHIEEFLQPYYLKIWDAYKNNGCTIFVQDSDGNMNSVIDAFLNCGLNQMYPMEPAAGMDIVKVHAKYGTRLSLKGGIDKFILRDSKLAVLRELEYKMQPSMLKGGIVFGLDHRIPNGSSLELYRYYVKTAREILGREPLDKKNKGWMRQAI